MPEGNENQSTKQKVLCSAEPINMGSGQKPEEITPTSLQNPWRVFFWEAFLFSLTLGLGIAAAFRINEILSIQKVVLPQLSLGKFIFYFLLATLFIFFVSYFLKFKKGKRIIFKVIFIFAIFFGGSLLLNVWIPYLLALVLMVILVFWWLRQSSVLIHNLCVILGIAGVGSILGLSFDPLIVVLLLIVFSFYDFIAVYKTKHMIKMAREMIESRAILALVVPSKISDFKERLEEIKSEGKFLILGSGDIVFPLLLSVSLIPSGIINSLIVATFALIGLFAGFYFFISQKARQPIPALPPIALFSIIGFFVTKLI